MSLNNASVLEGATLVDPTGGSAITFKTANGVMNGSNTCYVTSDSDLRTRRSFVASAKLPKPSATAPNGSTQARCELVFKSPLELDNGQVTVNTARYAFAYDPETSQAEVNELKAILIQCIQDADFADLIQQMAAD